MIRPIFNMAVLGALIWYLVHDIPPLAYIPAAYSLGLFVGIGIAGAFVKVIRVYLMRVLNSLSQFGNALLGPAFNILLVLEYKIRRKDRSALARYGFPDESISSVTHKNARKLWVTEPLRLILELIDPGHGARAVEPNEGRNFRSGFVHD